MHQFTEMHRTRVCGQQMRDEQPESVVFRLGHTANVFWTRRNLVAEYVKLNPCALRELCTMNTRLISYNIEMTEVTGGTFVELPAAATVYALMGNGSTHHALCF